MNLHGQGPESHRVLLALAPESLVSFRNSEVEESARGPEWQRSEHEVERWCRLLGAFGIDSDACGLHLKPPPTLAAKALRGATVIHPGAASAARRWPMGRWAAIARAEAAEGRVVVVTGSRREERMATGVVTLGRLPPWAMLAGKTRLDQLAALVASAGRVVCADTGIAHLATAFGVPSVVLFGPTSPDEWGPPEDGGRHIALWTGRRGEANGNIVDPGLLEIDVKSVLGALAMLPTADGRAGREPACRS